MSAANPVYVHQRLGFHFAVYPNRIEVTKGTTFPRKDTILVRSIIDIDVRRFSGTLRIKTIDGKKHDFILGLDAENARQVLLGFL